jgi:hypothetical protein
MSDAMLWLVTCGSTLVYFLACYRWLLRPYLASRNPPTVRPLPRVDLGRIIRPATLVVDTPRHPEQRFGLLPPGPPPPPPMFPHEGHRRRTPGTPPWVIAAYQMQNDELRKHKQATCPHGGERIRVLERADSMCVDCGLWIDDLLHDLFPDPD